MLLDSFLTSIALLQHESDFKIAQSLQLLPRHLTQETWASDATSPSERSRQAKQSIPIPLLRSEVATAQQDLCLSLRTLVTRFSAPIPDTRRAVSRIYLTPKPPL